MDAAILTQTEEMLDANTGTGPLAATLAETCPPPVRKANRRAARKQAAPRDQAAAPKAPDEPLVEVAMVPTPVVEDAAVAQVEAAAADAIVEPAAQPPACPEATQVGSPAAAAASPPSGPHVPVWAKLDLVARMQALRSARSAQIARLRGFAEDNGFKAAGIFVAVGAGWIIGANSFDDSAQTRRLTETMQAFASKLEQVEQTGLLTQGQEIGALRREIAALGSRLENVQSGTTKAAAQLSGRLDRFEHAGTDSRALEQLSQRRSRRRNCNQLRRAIRTHCPCRPKQRAWPCSQPAFPPMVMSCGGYGTGQPWWRAAPACARLFLAIIFRGQAACAPSRNALANGSSSPAAA